MQKFKLTEEGFFLLRTLVRKEVSLISEGNVYMVKHLENLPDIHNRNFEFPWPVFYLSNDQTFFFHIHLKPDEVWACKRLIEIAISVKNEETKNEQEMYKVLAIKPFDQLLGVLSESANDENTVKEFWLGEQEYGAFQSVIEFGTRKYRNKGALSLSENCKFVDVLPEYESIRAHALHVTMESCRKNFPAHAYIQYAYTIYLSIVQIKLLIELTREHYQYCKKQAAKGRNPPFRARTSNAKSLLEVLGERVD